MGSWYALSLGSDPCVGSLLGAACTKNLFVIYISVISRPLCLFISGWGCRTLGCSSGSLTRLEHCSKEKSHGLFLHLTFHPYGSTHESHKNARDALVEFLCCYFFPEKLKQWLQGAVRKEAFVCLSVRLPCLPLLM